MPSEVFAHTGQERVILSCLSAKKNRERCVLVVRVELSRDITNHFSPGEFILSVGRACHGYLLKGVLNRTLGGSTTGQNLKKTAGLYSKVRFESGTYRF